LIPALRFLQILGIYGLYLLYLGLPLLTKAPQEKSLVYTVVVIVAAAICERPGHPPRAETAPVCPPTDS